VAGLAYNERWRLDPHVRRSKDETEQLELDESEPCGSHNALLGHLWRGEQIDPKCWSAEIRRERLERVSATRKRRRAVAQLNEAPEDLKPAS
jgi:hypothetical protein